MQIGDLTYLMAHLSPLAPTPPLLLHGDDPHESSLAASPPRRDPALLSKDVATLTNLQDAWRKVNLPAIGFEGEAPTSPSGQASPELKSPPTDPVNNTVERCGGVAASEGMICGRKGWKTKEDIAVVRCKKPAPSPCQFRGEEFPCLHEANQIGLKKK